MDSISRHLVSIKKEVVDFNNVNGLQRHLEKDHGAVTVLPPGGSCIIATMDVAL